MNDKEIKKAAVELKSAAEKMAGLFYVVRISPKYQRTVDGEDYNLNFEICLQGHKEVLKKHFPDMKMDDEYLEKTIKYKGFEIQITGT